MTIHITAILGFVFGAFVWLFAGFIGTLFFSYPKDIEAKHVVGGFTISTIILLLIAGTVNGYIRWQL